MSYPPNAHGAQFLANEIFPLIRKQIKQELRLFIVGFNPTAQVKALARDNDIEVTGGVDSVQPYYAAADVVVAPLCSGGGTRIKILEAAAHNRPIVATTIGAEGIEFVKDQEILVADDAQSFADKVIEVLADENAAQRIAQAAFTRLTNTYSLQASKRYYRALTGQRESIEQGFCAADF